MKNFGYTDLVLVDPPVLGGEARAFAAGAQDLLMDARLETIDVLNEFDTVIGTSGIRAGGDKNPRRVPAHTPAELKERLSDRTGDTALIFGREDQGLYTEELDRCDLFVSITTSEESPVMNLSHAAAVVLYELSDVEPGGAEMADAATLDALENRIDRVVESSGIKDHKKERTADMLKHVFARAGPTAREAHTLMGLLKDLEKD